MVVERQLAAEGLTRQQLGRTEFEQRVWQWKEEYGGRINNQIRREGASVDWSRERFTMDPGLSRAVRETFVRLWERGLIYRGEYMVNWCPRCQTAISDVETLHEPFEGHLWHIRYRVTDSEEGLVVATTRPETMLGDTALIVNPEDPRYKHLHGKTAILPLMNRELPIIADNMADPKFGTGVVKITPAHDPNDFEAGKRHGLPSVKVIGEDGRMTAAAGAFAGLDRFEARKRIVAALESFGQLVQTEPYTVNLSKCDRCKTVIEPLVSTQWFVRMKPLAEKAMDAVRSGRIRFIPDDREILFFQWMENIRDWCISRQLWWGHQIPAWHCRNCSQMTVARETPPVCPHCQSTEVQQDSDVLDTWFSSGLWPFSTLGWPDDTADLRTFYPTSLLITGFDILFFWVSRMIVLGLECTGNVPFREVHMHGLVRDANGKKMSKTKGNVVDPLDLIDECGTDALKIALLLSAAPGADISLRKDRMEAAQAFANKLWNASRLLFMNMERSGVHGWRPRRGSDVFSAGIEDDWIAERLSSAARLVNRALEQHRYHEAAETLWHFVWHEFCDWYLEVKKLRFTEGSGTDRHWEATLAVYEEMLRLLHPFMPFITEELWQRLMQGSDHQADVRSISLASYPRQRAVSEAEQRVRAFGLLQSIVTAARELRADNKLDPKTRYEAVLSRATITDDQLRLIESLTRLTLTTEQSSRNGKQAISRSTAEFDLTIEASATGDVARIVKEIADLERAIAQKEARLNDPKFTSRAPEEVRNKEMQACIAYKDQLQKNRDLLARLQ
jgi:valyl-tRNA synthetase